MKTENAKTRTVEGRGDDRQQSKVEGRAEGAKETVLRELRELREKGQKGLKGRKGRRARSDAPYQSERAQLVGVLEEFGISPGTFDGLRSDCYEKHIAARSLAELKSVYLTLLKPIEGSEEMQRQFPRWSAEHHRHGGKLPSINTLMGIKNRMMAEQTANDIGTLMQQVQMIHSQTGKLPGDLQGQVYNAMLAVIGQELFKAKFEGKPMSQNLAVVDRLMKAAVMRYRERQGDKRNEQRDRAHKIQEGRLALARQRKPMIGGTAPKLSAEADTEVQVPLPEVTAEEYDPEAMDETDLMLEKVFGKNPYKDQGKVQNTEAKGQGAKTVESPADDRQQSKVEGQAEAEVNHQDAKAQSGEAKGGKETVLRELRELREGDKQPETKTDNHEIHEKGKEVGLVELVPPVEAKTAEVKVDTRPEWARRMGNKLIGGRSAKHPKGILRCDETGLPVDVATGKPVEDVDWTTLIGFGGDGEKALN